MTEIISVRFRETGKAYSFDPNGINVKKDEAVIVETARGIEYGIVTAANHEAEEQEVVAPLRKVLRRATEEDRRIAEENRIKEKKAATICQQKIAEHNIEMKCIDVEYAFDGSKILFYFTADGRVDFRELVRDLAGVFKTRIELRQVGVRDEAKLLGGLGICGRPFCCASFLDDFQPVSIKMAKEQNLSLNPTKISGTCGRLMCCLKYEQEAYEDLIRTTPKVSSVVETPQGVGTVVDVSLMTGKLKVRLDDSTDLAPKCFNKCDVCVKRGPTKQVKAESSSNVDPELSKLEDSELSGEQNAPAKDKPNNKPRRDKKQKIRAQQAEQKNDAQPTPKAEQADAGDEKKPHRRNNYHHRRRRHPNGGNAQNGAGNNQKPNA